MVLTRASGFQIPRVMSALKALIQDVNPKHSGTEGSYTGQDIKLTAALKALKLDIMTPIYSLSCGLSYISNSMLYCGSIDSRLREYRLNSSRRLFLCLRCMRPPLPGFTIIS